MRNNFSRSEERSKIALMSFAILTAAGLVAGGCSTIGGTDYAEPRIIIVRNSSGINLAAVSLRGVREPGADSIRVGTISPVGAGVSQVFKRPTQPPPLPKRVVISWAVNAQRRYEREISLERVLTDPDAQTRDSLVFEITASGRVSIYKE